MSVENVVIDAFVSAKMGRAMAALGLRFEPMRGVWNGASSKERIFICRIVNVVNEGVETEHGARAGVGAYERSWDELSEPQRVLIADCFMRLKSWVKKLDLVREGGVHHG